MKEFVRTPNLATFKAKCVPQGKEATIILRLLGFIRFKLTLSKFKRLDFNKISSKPCFSLITIGWGAGEFLNKQIARNHRKREVLSSLTPLTADSTLWSTTTQKAELMAFSLRI